MTSNVLRMTSNDPRMLALLFSQELVVNFDSFQMRSYISMYNRLCPSVRSSVRPSVRPSHTNSISGKWLYLRAELEQKSMGNT